MFTLFDTGNLVHSTIVSGEFWEAIGGKVSNSMDYKVGTADSQLEGLKVLGVGKPWLVLDILIFRFEFLT